LKNHSSFDEVYGVFVELLANLGHVDAATEALTFYEATLEGKDARYIHYCDMQCYLHWVSGEFPLAIKWGLAGEELRATGVDTAFSSAHHLALAQRDSGAVDPALKYFLNGRSLEEATDPGKVDVDLDGAFYGNVGRCLHLMGQAEPAIACYRKSARIIEDDAKGLHENQAYIRQWVGELLHARGEKEFARHCFEAAIEKWSVMSPPKANRLRTLVTSMYEGSNELIDPVYSEASFLAWIEELHEVR